MCAHVVPYPEHVADLFSWRLRCSDLSLFPSLLPFWLKSVKHRQADGRALSSPCQRLPPRPPPHILPRPPHPKLSSLRPAVRNQRPPSSYPRIKAVELDQNTLVAISVGVVSIAVGIGIPVFYETQIDSAAKRENKQPCFPCNGSGAQLCRFCMGSGTVTVDLGGDENEVSRCINCDGVGSLTCTTCQGSGIQPRYLDRREFKDDD